MSTTTTVVLISPGATDFTAQHRVLGGLTMPLSEEGEHQVERSVSLLAGLGLETLYSADSDPSLTTAQILADALDVPVHLSPLLRDQHLGLWEGIETDDLARKFGKRCCSKGLIHELEHPPEGETGEEVRHRVEVALRKPLRRNSVLGIVAGECLQRHIREWLHCDPGVVLEEDGRQLTCHVEMLTVTLQDASFAGRAWSMLYGLRGRTQGTALGASERKSI